MAKTQSNLRIGDAELWINNGVDAEFVIGHTKVRLHPRNKAASDYTEDIYIWKAVSSESVER